MAKGLYNTAHEEEQAAWPQIELTRQIEAENFNSILACSAPIQASTISTFTSASFMTPNPQSSQHISIQPPETPLTPGFSQKVVNLTKLYTEEQKYSGEDDNFEYKLNIFNNACK